MIFLVPVIAGIMAAAGSATTITITGGISAAACGAIATGLGAGVTKALVEKHREKKRKDEK